MIRIRKETEEPKLLPCPFCGAVPVIRWEPWREISEECGIFQLQAVHRDGCFIRMMNGANATGRMSAGSEKWLAEVWNMRAR